MRPSTQSPRTSVPTAPPEAFEQVYARMYAEARGFARRYVGSLWCDDVVQDAFLSLWTRCYKECDPPAEPVDALVYKILRRRIIDVLRAQSVRAEVDGAEERIRDASARIENQMDTAGVAEGKMLSERIDSITSTFPPKARQAFEAGRVNGFDAKATAEAMGISYDAARWHLKEGLNRVRAALERDGYRVPQALRPGRRSRRHT